MHEACMVMSNVFNAYHVIKFVPRMKNDLALGCHSCGLREVHVLRSGPTLH